MQGNRSIFYGGVVAAVLIVIAAALVVLIHMRQQAQAQTTVSTQSLARAMELTLEGVISTIDLALLDSADEIASQIHAGNVARLSIDRSLSRQKGRLPLVAFVRGVNQRGDVVYGPDTGSLLLNHADRDYFIHLRDHPKSDLFIERPYLDQAANQWVWLFARRIDKPDGSFGGAVFAVVNVEQIEKMLAQIKMDPGGSIALRDAGLGLISRYTFARENPIPVGDTRLSVPFADALKANPQEGTYVSDGSSLDDVSRRYNYRRNARYGFVVNVGMAGEEALDDWRKQAWGVAGLALAFVLAALVHVLLIRRAWLRQAQDMAALEASRQALREHDSRYREVVEFSSDGFWVIDLEGRICDVNEAYARRSGYSREELLSMRVKDLEANEAPAEIEAHLRNIAGDGADTFETLHRARDGRVWPVEIAVRSRADHPDQVLGFLRDITARKRAETLLHTRLRLAELAQAGRLEAFLQKVLDVAEELTGSKIGFFHYVDPDQEHLTLQAWSTNTLAHMCTAEGKGQHYAISAAGVWVDAFHARAPVIHNDYASLARKQGLPPGHAPVIRELVVPIIRKGKITEIIGVGNKPSDYVQADVEVLQVIAEMIQDLTDRIRAEAEVRTLSRAVEQSPASIVITDRTGRIEYVNPRFEQVTGYARDEAVGQNPRILKSGTVPDETYAQLWATISAGNEWRGELCNRRKNGEMFWEYAAISGLKDESGEVGHFIAVKEDITELKDTEASLQRVSNLYAALSQCSQAVVHCLTEQELFEQVCRAIVNFGGMKMAWIGRTDATGKRAVPVASWGDNTEYLDGIEISLENELPSGRGPTGTAIRENRACWCEDFLHDPATAHWHERGRSAGWRGSAAVPIRRSGAAVGALTIYSSMVDAFDEAARKLLAEMAENIGFALDKFAQETERRIAEDSARHANAQLRELAVRLNRMHEAESSLLSRELHDEFGQMLTRIKMDLSWLATRLREQNPDLKKKVDASLELVDASVKSVRDIAARLRPRILDELGLLSAIDWLVQDFRERSGIDAAFVASAEVDALSQERSTAVFRIVQESLSNISRHADAKCVDVSLLAENGWLTVEVRDDGRGVEEDETTSYESIGLLGMRERALAAGGELMFHGVPGRGTVVTLRLPTIAEGL